MYKKTILSSILMLLFVNLSVAQCVSGAVNSAIWGTPDDFTFGFTADADITDEDTLQIIQGVDTTVVIQYLLPKKQNITSPITGTATVNSVQIQGVTGLPVGMNWTLDATATANNNTYNPQTGRYGSVTICGTTFSSPGVKTLTVSTLGCGSMSGISDCAPVTFPLYIEVLPGQGGNSAFTITPPIGCNSMDVDFEAIFQSPDPILFPVDFLWDLGSGNTSTATTINAHSFSSPGIYPVKLDVIINEFYISSASVICSGGWYPDIEELSSLQSPEPYLIINGTTTSSENGNSASWSGLDITLNSTTINGQTFDEDNGGLLGSSDDDLGSGSTTIIPSDGGSYGISTSNSSIIVNVSKRVSEVLTFWDTVKVYSNSVATLASSNGNSFCGTDSTILSIGTGYDAVQWFMDTTLLLGETNSDLTVNTSGSYFAEVVASGSICAGVSNTISISVDGLTVPVIMPSTNGIEIDNPNGYIVQWYSDGVPIPAATGNELTDLSSGNPFSVTITNSNGCEAISADYEGCIEGYADAPDGTDVDGSVATTFDAIGFSYNSQTQVAWSVSSVSDGMITTVADVDALNPAQVYLGDGNSIDLLLDCNFLSGDGSYYLTPFLIEATELDEFPFPYTDTTCIPFMGLDINFDCVNQDWEIGSASVIDPAGTPIDLLSLSPVAITYPIGPSLICTALGGVIPGVNLFAIAPNSNPNGTWSIEVTNSGSGDMDITVPAFQVSLTTANCSDITTDMVYDYGPYDISIAPGGTESITIRVPPLPTDFPSIASSCSAFGTPVEIDVTNCPTGIEDIISNEDVSLYPNPNNGKFTLDFEVLETTEVYISLIDMTGRTILNRNYSNISGNFTESFDLKNNLNSGFYFMNIQVGEYTIQKKFIVK